jgi:hypothetical protein
VHLFKASVCTSIWDVHLIEIVHSNDQIQYVNHLEYNNVACRLAKADTHEQHGWPHLAYGASKTGVILLSKIQQANIDKDSSRQDIVINSVSC